MFKRRDLLTAVAALAFVGTASAQDAVDVAKAKAEAKVVWYTSTPIEQGQKIVGLFEKAYGIKVEMFRSGGSAILRRFQQENDAGRIRTGEKRQALGEHVARFEIRHHQHVRASRHR